MSAVPPGVPGGEHDDDADDPARVAFARLVEAARAAVDVPGVQVRESPAPRRVAPLSAGLSGTARARDASGSGRLVLLHDPAGVESWQGDTRAVVEVRAPVDTQTAADGLLAPVAWSWLVDAVASHVGEPVALAGAVTTETTTRFGAADPAAAAAAEPEVQVRGSWTCHLEQVPDSARAWADLLARLAGLPPPGVRLLRR